MDSLQSPIKQENNMWVLANSSSPHESTATHEVVDVKSLGGSAACMDMDSIQNIWTAEEAHAIDAALGGAAECDNESSCLKKQESMSLESPLSLPNPSNTDALWSDTAAQGTQQPGQVSNLGEMSLEDFLIKAGIVKEQIDPGGQDELFAPSESATTHDTSFEDRAQERGSQDEEVAIPPRNFMALQSESWASNQYSQVGNAMAQQHPNIFQSQAIRPTSVPIYANGGQVTETLGGLGNIGHGIGRLSSSGIRVPFGAGLGQIGAISPHGSLSDELGPSDGDVSALLPTSYDIDESFGGRKQSWEVSMEKVVERRQRRMIKNRESAARSRARKQAYTVELETEIRKLKEENMRLRKQQEELVTECRKQNIIEGGP